MNIKFFVPQMLALCAVAAMATAPMVASAQSRGDIQHRKQSRDQWKDIGIAGGAVGILGLLTHNDTLAVAGIGGGLYSAYRYDQDQKSLDKSRRARAELYRHTSFDHQGHHYTRHTVVKKGHKYYKFTRDN